MKNLHSFSWFIPIYLGNSRRPRINSQIEYSTEHYINKIGCVAWPSLEKEYYPFFQNIFLQIILEILYTTSEFLGMQLIIVSLKRKEEIQINVSLIFAFYYQRVFLKYFLQLMLRIVVLYPTSSSSNTLKNNVACYGQWRSFTSWQIGVSGQKCWTPAYIF